MQVRQDVRDSVPTPGAAALEHSRGLVARLREHIRVSGGVVSFAEYMRFVLYEPGFGYYSGGARKFGADGDFITAPEVSPLFSRVLARQVAEMLAALGGGDMLEMGAGSGRMAADLLEALAAADTLPERYFIMEVSGDLRARQRHLLAERDPALLRRVHWLDELPGEPLRGVVLANEVADALPVERFRREESGVSQAVVTTAGDAEALAVGWRPAPAFLIRAVSDIENRLGRRLAPGYVSEISLGLEGWLGDVATALGAGFLLLSDYGFGEREYYAAERDMGTFRCHYRHRAHDDALLWPGLQDLTAWVDFSALARAGAVAGLEVAGYTTQAHFLIAAGLEAELTGLECLAERERLALSAAVKTLTLPGEMGEAFRFMVLRRGCDLQPRGFSLGDLRHTL